MALYNVVAPCIVGGKHYTRPSKTPVEVSNAEAKDLLESGALEFVSSVEKVEPGEFRKAVRARRKGDNED